MDGTSSLTSSPFMAPFNGLAPPPPPPPMPTTSANNNNNNSYELPPPFSFLSNVNSSNASQASTTQAALAAGSTHFGIGSSSHNGGGGDGGLSNNNASSSIIITSGGGSNNTEKCIWVLDPMTRKLRVPLTYLVPTQATATHGTVPSLCIAFLEGRCRHPWCRQAHVMPSMISQLRHDALNAPTCCARHHDPHEITMLTSRFATITVSESSMQSAIPTDCIALTVGLQRYIAHSVPPDLPGPNLDIPSKLICRLHLSHRCRYLEDCNNIHVCREFDLRLHPPPFMMGPLQNLNVATRTIVLGDVVYSVTPLAVGELCDEDFHMICEQQQNRHQSSSSTNNAAAPHHNGHSATNSNVQSPFLQSTSNSPLLCGIPYVDAALGGYGATNGGNQPLLHGTTHPSESPLHGAVHGSHTGGGMGTPNASFSTPPLAAMRQSTSAPSTGMLPPPAFSSPPSGLPTFCSQTPNSSTTAAAETTSHNVWTTPNNATSQGPPPPRSTSPTRPAATTWSAHLAAANTLTLASTQQQQSQNSQGHHPSSEQQLGNSSISKQLLDVPGGGKQSPTSAGAGSATTTMLPPPPFGAASTSSPAPSGASSPNAKRQPLRVYDIRTTVGGPTHHHHQHHHVSPVLQGQQHYALPPPPSHHAHQHHQHPAHHHHRHGAPHYQQHAAPPYNGGSMTPEGAGRPQSHHHVQ